MSHSTTTSTDPVRHVLARTFAGKGGVIEPGQKTIIIAVLLGMLIGAIFSDGAGRGGVAENALAADNAAQAPVAILATD